MRTVSHLEKLVRVLSGRTYKLEVMAREVQEREIQDCSVELIYVVIETLTTWTNFCRSYYLSCSVGRARQLRGTYVTHSRSNIVDEHDALIEAIAEVKPNILPRVQQSPRIRARDEPNWHDKQTLVRLSSRMQFSNNPDIVVAFSYPSTFMSDLPTVRNFFAHRCYNTARKVENLAKTNYGLTELGHPSDLINKVITGRAESLIVEWLIDMRKIGYDLCC